LKAKLSYENILRKKFPLQYQEFASAFFKSIIDNLLNLIFKLNHKIKLKKDINYNYKLLY